MVAVSRSEELRFTDMCGARGLPCRRIGVVDGDIFDVQDAFAVSLDELQAAHSSTLPGIFGAVTV